MEEKPKKKVYNNERKHIPDSDVEYSSDSDVEYSSDEEVVKKPVRKRKCTCEEEGPERAAKTSKRDRKRKPTYESEESTSEEEGPERAAKTSKRDRKRKPTYESEDETPVTPVKKSRPGLHNYDGTFLCRAGKC